MTHAEWQEAIQAERSAVEAFGWLTAPLNMHRKPYMGYKWKTDPKPWEFGIPGIAGFGIVVPDGYIIVDVDSDEALQRLSDAWGEGWGGFHIETPNGWHYWFKSTAFSKNLSLTSLGEGIEVKAPGKSLMPGPLSRRHEGKYKRIGEWHEIAELPPQLESALLEAGEVVQKGIEPDLQTSAKSPKANIVHPVYEGIDIAEGNRNNTLTPIVFGLVVASPLSEASCYELGESLNMQLKKPLPKEEVDAMVKGALDKRASLSADADWVPMEYTPQHYQKAGFRTRILEAGVKRMGYLFRHNLRSDSPEIWDHDKGKWRDVFQMDRDALLHRARTRLFTGGRLYLRDGKIKVSRLNHFDWTKGDLKGVIADIEIANQVDPLVADYMDHLPEWDGVKRIDSLFADYFDIRDTPHAIAVIAGRSLMLGMVERCLDPGCKHDEMVVLIGGEGGLKSTFCQALVPDDKFFSDSFTFESDTQKMVEQTRGKVLVEAAEMQALSGKCKAQAKQMLSATHDQVRLSYRTDSVAYPRRFVFIGTSNNERVLPHDPKGNRRFIPIRAERKIVDGKIWERDAMLERLDSERNQLWAEAVRLVREGKSGKVPTAMAVQVQDQTRLFAYDPDELERIEDVVEDYDGESVMDFEVREKAGIGDHISDKKLRMAIREHGRVVGAPVRIREKNCRGYRFPLRAKIELPGISDDEL